MQLIISKGSQQGRRALLSCVLRLMQASWNIGNFNAVMEILLGLRSVQLYYIYLWTVNDVTGKTPWKDPPMGLPAYF